jgi:hypothetical protein
MAKTQKGKTQHRSMRGKIVDMDLLQKKNELTPAIGNARVNARGDVLGAGGKIVKTRDQVVREHYNNGTKEVIDEAGGFKTTKKPEVVQEEKINLSDLTSSEKDLFEDDDWVEDDQGNFIKPTISTKTTTIRKGVK